MALWRAARAARRFIESGIRGSMRGRTAHDGGDLVVNEGEAGAQPIPSLDAFARVLARDAGLTASELGEACARVSEWAEESLRPETHMEFAELAARADPDNPARANTAGRACREAGHMERASVWFERAFRLAVAQRNREQSVRALLGNGALMKECGRLEDARRWFLKAARRAARTGRMRRAAEARHDLMALAAETGDLPRVLEHAVAAVELYPLHHGRFPYLAHDFAFALMKQRHYALAYPVLEAFIRVVPTQNLLPGLATYAWAAAARGLAHRFAEAETRVRKHVARDQQQAAPALVLLAEGARSLGRWEVAESLARGALEAAERHRQARFAEDAKTLLDEILDRNAPPENPEPASFAGAEFDALLRHLRARLRRWKPRRSRPDREVDERRYQEERA